jgi:hypothetical protein
MMRVLVGVVLLALSTQAAAAPRPAVRDPVSYNIGASCRWQKRCIAQQREAMKAALNYVGTQRPPFWRIELCNRNARRVGHRVDWIGFNNCIRNAALRPPVVPAAKKKRRRIFG